MSVKITASYLGDDKVELVHGPSGGRLVTDLPAVLKSDLDGFSRTVTKMAARAGHPNPTSLAEHLGVKLRVMVDAHLYGTGKEASPDVFAPLVDASL